MTQEQASDIFNTIPDKWYEAAIRTIEIAMAARYYAHNSYSWTLPHVNTTLISFYIDINEISHLPNEHFEDDGVFQKIDKMIHSVTWDIAKDFALKALESHGYQNAFSEKLVDKNLVPLIYHKIGVLSDALRNKTVFFVISRNMQLAEDIAKRIASNPSPSSSSKSEPIPIGTVSVNNIKHDSNRG